MNDEQVIAAIREQRAKVALAVPVEDILRRGDAIRARRVMPTTGGALALAIVAALGVSLLVAHGADRQPGHHREGFTLTAQVNGNIAVTISQLQDPAVLQSQLRGDGVPASVTFSDQMNPACQAFPGGAPGPSQDASLLEAVFPTPYQDPRNLAPPAPSATPVTGTPTPPLPLTPASTIVVIDPSALPNGAGVQLAISASGEAFLLPQLVLSSSQCTGS